MPENIEILPLEVVAQAFPARPAALPDVRDFVRRQLTGTPVSDEDVRVLCERVADVLLDAAGAAGTIQVSLRIFPDSAEVDVLFAPDVPAIRPATAAKAADPVPAPAPRPAVPQSFSNWLAARLRQEGLTLEAAARRLDVSTKTVSRWVAGTTEPRLRDLYRIRETFGEPFH
ncbi:helix-turn-helix domain-containing protein [Paractinoplanes rishiriensis]|uniref:XRE family transcriptional regulator n=1 Tax=Paractinoplanes rishiriensis TaxID=1050105 RepID=A0A919K818_9ACTN|nr:helix-turn-helix transcriptional regulator [Actinoplanes rishiriensis]GIF00601.1 XRE family transcriptional regulator [Actinoplanes rishiriensis]